MKRGYQNAIGYAPNQIGYQPQSGDADSQAFITAAGITDSTQKTAINNLVVALKNYGIWTKMQAIYPIVGGTAASHKWNLKDPRDLNAAFRLVFSGGWIHSATGALMNGTNGYADTFYNQNTHGTLNSEHFSNYTRTNFSENTGSGLGLNNTSYEGTNILPRISSDAFYTRSQCAAPHSLANNDSRGFFLVSRTGSTGYRKQKNATSTNVTQASISLVSRTFYLGALNAPMPLYASKEIAFASIGTGLTETEAGNLYAAVQAFQTALSRSVP